MIKLILSGDDFGLHSSINEAIEDAYRNGVLTSASLVANGEKFDEAVRIIKRNPGLGVGLHFTLDSEAPAAPPAKIHTLLNSRGLLLDRNDFLKKILLKQIKQEHIVLELESQIQRFFDSGINFTHFDGHGHIHLFPPVFNLIKDILCKYNITKMRYINIPWFGFRDKQLFKMFAAFFFKTYALIKKRKYKHPDYFLGFYDTGNIDFKKFLFWLKRIKKNGTYEFCFHPGKNDAVIAKKYEKWNQYFPYLFSWEKDFLSLTDLNVKKNIKSSSLKLINYKNI